MIYTECFYRATFPENESDYTAGQGCAYAESNDGINWRNLISE